MSLPDSESLQVTLLGRGVGECIVVHLPGGDWLVVDSFNHRGEAAALYHFAREGISSENVIGLVVTHFHADHYRKIDALHEGCVNAKLYITEALHRDRIKAFALDPSEPSILEVLPRTVQRAKDRSFPEPGGSGRVSLKSGTLVSNPRRNHTVLALSPSDFAVAQSDADLAALIGTAVDPQEVKAQLKDDNRCSIVLYIDVGFATVMLGADLECEPLDAGWAAVHATHKHLPPAGLLKVPHHGSKTADHHGLWELTEDGAELIVSPYWSSGIPDDHDVIRLATRGNLWQTVPSTKAKTQVLGDQPPQKEPLGWLTATCHPDKPKWTVDPGGAAFLASARRS